MTDTPLTFAPVQPSRFLEPADLVKLTGRHQKSKQVEWLRAHALPFWVSATRHPVLTWDAINGTTSTPPAPPRW